MSDKLDKIKKKIAALMAMAKNHAASEAEANKALEVAQKLMAENSLSLEDIAEGKVSPTDFGASRADPDRKKLHEIDSYCGNAIGRFCDVKVFADRVNGGTVFFGYNVDVELALYIRDLLIKTVEYEWDVYYAGLTDTIRKRFRDKNGKPVHGRTLRKGFFIAFIDRIKERLAAMKGEMIEAVANGNGNALVVVKTQLVKSAFETMMSNVNLRNGAQSKYVRYASVEEAGRNAADKVKFNRAVGGQHSQLMIGGN